jgi:hypothetical protein
LAAVDFPAAAVSPEHSAAAGSPAAVASPEEDLAAAASGTAAAEAAVSPAECRVAVSVVGDFSREAVSEGETAARVVREGGSRPVLPAM